MLRDCVLGGVAALMAISAGCSKNPSSPDLSNSTISPSILCTAGNTSPVHSVVVSPDGNTIISGGRDNTIKVWDLADGTLLRTLTGHTHNVRSVAISPAGKTIVSGSRDKTVKAWRLSDGKLLETLTDHTDGVHSVAVSPDGSFIASGGMENASIVRWDVDPPLPAE